jgi:sugar/nucleoside kinase (ribokinase family)
MLDLLVVGDANPDVLVGGAPEVPRADQAETLVESGTLALGGSAAIVAHGAARLGLRTGLAAMVGRDAAGDFVLDTLTAAGVDITACERHDTLPTALTVCLNRPGGDRAILTAPGCLPAFTPKSLKPAKHLHSASYFLQPRLAADLPRLFAIARESGTTTSLDTNDDPSGDWRLAPGLLDVCDFLLPNEAEARRLSGHDDLEEALAALAGSGRTAVVKRGAAGALARRGEKLWAVRPAPVQPGAPLQPGAAVLPGTGAVAVADTVGAGDSFDAGFIAGWLATGSLPAALALATACGTLSTRAIGGTAAQPDRDEAESLARTLIQDDRIHV